MPDTLPIHAVLDEITSTFIRHNQLILQAPPGAGKTTVVPIALLERVVCYNKKIVMLEPRRLAARNAAVRMAGLLGEKVGERVGYRIRQEVRVSAVTRIEVVTEGILTRMLQSDPALEEVGIVIFDEFHERSVHADLGLALALQTQQLLREDLKIMVMSATLNAAALKKVIPDAPVVTSEGRTFPVDIRYLDITARQPDAGSIAASVCKTVLKAIDEDEGSVLVFLPGTREIRAVEGQLRTSLDAQYDVAPLYGDLSKTEQQRAIAPATEGRRKIVLATNIAETSLTIEGVRVVVDSGLERSVQYDAGSGMNRMRTQMITQDSAVQRAGRAGRTQSGVCYRLWHENRALVPHARAEILHSDIAPVLLELAKWGASVDELSWVDLPPKHAQKAALDLLISLNIIDSEGRLTVHGEAALMLGVHPRLAHMLLRAKAKNFAYEAVLVAVLLQENTGIKTADLSEGVRQLSAMLVRRACSKLLTQAVDTLCKKLDIRSRDTVQTDTIGPLVTLAYPERIAKRRTAGSSHFLLANGKGAVLNDATAFVHEEYIAVADTGGAGEALRIYRAAPLTLSEIESWSDEHIQTHNRIAWNQGTGRVEAEALRSIGAVVLERRRIDTLSNDQIAAGVLEGIRTQGLQLLPWDKKSLSLRERVNFINAHMPETFPSMDDVALLKALEEWLLPYLEGIRNIKGLQRLEMYTIVAARIGWDGLQELDALAPETVRVPSGSCMRIDYCDPAQPVLAVRLQEMFGQRETPTVLGGKVALMLHLLSPAQRPVQVTQDLVSFWNSGYADVRKELRGRYKKHYWPQDPYEAIPTSKTKKGISRE